MRPLAGLLIAVFTGALARAQELPTKSSGDRLDFEPELLLHNPVEPLGGEAAKHSVATGLELERARLAVERSRRKAARWQALQKRGVLSRVEAEGAALQVLQASAKFASLQAHSLREQVEICRAKVAAGDAKAAELNDAESAARNADVDADQARMKFEAAKSAAAAINLDRLRKLYAAGLISRTQLKRAEAAQHASNPQSR